MHIKVILVIFLSIAATLITPAYSDTDIITDDDIEHLNKKLKDAISKDKENIKENAKKILGFGLTVFILIIVGSILCCLCCCVGLPVGVYCCMKKRNENNMA